MSQVEEIATELGALTAGVDRAQGQAAAASRQAEEVARQATAAGFAAVATGMLAVRQAIAEVQGRLASLGDLIGEAAKVTAAVPQEGSPQESIAGLAPVQERLDRAREAASATIEQVDKVQRLVTVTLQGGQPESILAALRGITQILVPLTQRIGNARQLTDVAIVKARQLGSAAH